jgi:hypothetical protein
MFVDKYSSASPTTAEFTGSESIGLCGVGSKTCYDIVLPSTGAEEPATLFRELPPDHPDYNAELQKLARETNKFFRERAHGLLTGFTKTVRNAKGEVHMAAIGSKEGLYLAYATRLPSEQLIRTGANVAKQKFRNVVDQIMTPPKGKPTRAKKE